jgi:hypothetical protein
VSFATSATSPYASLQVYNIFWQNWFDYFGGIVIDNYKNSRQWYVHTYFHFSYSCTYLTALMYTCIYIVHH